jgi:soluble lytic murein transglycosylase-like protein
VAATVDGQPPGAAQSWYRALPYRDEVEQAAREFGLDASLLHAVIGVESGHSAAAVSAKGAIGLMQLMPPTARRFGVADAYDPLQNIRGGARYLRYLLDLFGGDVELALAAYNAGENAVLRHGRRVPPFRETIEYVRKVRQHRPS